jgi:hypothetical protein
MSNLLSVENCSIFLKLCESIYAHPFINGDYFGKFLKGWLVHKKGHPINLALYAWDNNQEQMRRAIRNKQGN